MSKATCCHHASVDAVTGAAAIYAGSFNRPRMDGAPANAGFPGPGQLNTAPDGSLWIIDGGFLRHIALDGTVTSLEGLATVRSFAIDTEGTIYIGTIDGLYALQAGVTSGAVTPTLLIPPAPSSPCVRRRLRSAPTSPRSRCSGTSRS